MAKSNQASPELKSDLASAQSEINILRQKVEHQNHLLKSIWTILKSNFDINDEDLETIMRNVVQEADRTQETAEICPNCSRHLQKNTTICIYCGAETNHQHLF